MNRLILLVGGGLALTAALALKFYGGLIRDCGGTGSFRAAPYAALAAELQSLPKLEALQKLERWAEYPGYDEQVILLCRMLFEPRLHSQFRGPRLGAPSYYGESEYKDWPLSPITVIDDIPFLIVQGYTLAGQAEGAPEYLAYCLSNADWTTRRYHPVPAAQLGIALQKLLKSPVWKRPLEHWEAVDLAEQIQ